jgi:hypothetical protein
MSALSPKVVALGVVLFGMGIASTLIAQSLAQGPQRQELQRADLSGASGMEVIASLTEYRPGDQLPRHFHHGIEAGFVVQGASIRLPNGTTSALATGANLLNLRDVQMAVHHHWRCPPVLHRACRDKGKPLYDAAN